MSASRMTIPWDRGDQMGLLPPDSSVVYPEPIMTIAWEPLTTPTIFDYDPADLLITPGAGEDVAPPPGESGGGSPPASGGGGEAPPEHHFGRPRIHVAHRRSAKLFLKEGLFVDVHPTAPARVRAVLRATVRGTKGRPRHVNLTKLVVSEVGTDGRKLTLHPSRAGRRTLARVDGAVPATLFMVVRYGGGQKAIRTQQHVTIVGA